MSNYCTTTHIRTRIDLPNFSRQIEQLCGTNNTDIQDTILEQYMEEACGLMDSFLVNKYTVPITTIADNPFLRGIALDISILEFFKRGAGDSVPSKFRKNFDAAMLRLKDLSDSVIAVPDAETAIKNTSIDVLSDTPLFREVDLVKYK